MKIAILQTGKTTEKFVYEGVKMYMTRLKKYCQAEIITVPDLKNTRHMPAEEQKLREGRMILKVLGKDDFPVLLDERGREFGTTDFAAWLEERLLIKSRRLVFIIGGPWGFSDELVGAAGFKLSLSKMTFPHQLVRLLFAEQLYRAFTVIRGEPYHHE
ncbi:MAG: 23S rRNA (pseudouridine(1915)-N(3))-methyltransferase RlmH [Bacteroidales bacterium]|nr:23S rRNA (pseudouridine(1915)-N(3))-methyltransferase RlmH [Bacteroidales bacterium]MBN2632364.1 23S rRNA (pseudouridine(1915)-N(3))-methyltransferase RlmH [Bacteroidales bacterium]